MASDIEIKEAIEKVFKIDKLKEEQRAIAVAALKKKLHSNFTDWVWKVIFISNVYTAEKNATDSRCRPYQFCQIFCVFANNCVNGKSNGQIELYSKGESSLQR